PEGRRFETRPGSRFLPFEPPDRCRRVLRGSHSDLRHRRRSLSPDLPESLVRSAAGPGKAVRCSSFRLEQPAGWEPESELSVLPHGLLSVSSRRDALFHRARPVPAGAVGGSGSGNSAVAVPETGPGPHSSSRKSLFSFPHRARPVRERPEAGSVDF